MRLLALLLISGVSIELTGQTFQGGVRGRVTDSAAGVIAGARAQLVNQSSNVALDTLTNEQGEYSFPSVNPATYALILEHSGFKRHERRDIVIATQSFYTVDVTLEVGDVSQGIQVTGEAPLMETVIPSAGGGLTARQLESLPNIGRNPFMLLAKVAPNIVPVGDSRYIRFQDQAEPHKSLSPAARATVTISCWMECPSLRPTTGRASSLALKPSKK